MCPTGIALGGAQRFVTHGDTAMHLLLAMIAFAGVVSVIYWLVIILIGRSLSR